MHCSQASPRCTRRHAQDVQAYQEGTGPTAFPKYYDARLRDHDDKIYVLLCCLHWVCSCQCPREGFLRCGSTPDLALASARSRMIGRELGLTAPDGGCSLFLLSFGCDSSGYYRVAHRTALIPSETPCPCRTLVACLLHPPLGRHRPLRIGR